tara:strand:+ start:19204 stop:19761 length:558 start_codon:yes stop_codon:yes gene_type:complete
MDSTWFANYFNLYNGLHLDKNIIKQLIDLKEIIEEKSKNNKIYIFGNGGSAAIASHVAVDFSKNAQTNMMTFNEYDHITCLANDYGFDKWVEKTLEMYANNGDMVILISSSGNSMNMVNAAKYAKDNDINVVTFTGFDKNNKLKMIGDLNFWVNSRAYNIVEMIHQIWLLSVCDSIIGSAEYSAS